MIKYFPAPTMPIYTPIPTLNASVNAAPSLVPNIMDNTAPDAQAVCPGYKASNFVATDHGYTADLDLAGAPCNAYGMDIAQLSLTVEYQNTKRLAVKIVPRFLAPSNMSQYILPAFITGMPDVDEGATLTNNELKFMYTNDPSFQFSISRGGDVIFSTIGTVIVFEDQFLELVTSMVSDYNTYGLAEHISDFRLSNNSTHTFYAADDGNPIDGHATPYLVIS